MIADFSGFILYLLNHNKRRMKFAYAAKSSFYSSAAGGKMHCDVGLIDIKVILIGELYSLFKILYKKG